MSTDVKTPTAAQIDAMAKEIIDMQAIVDEAEATVKTLKESALAVINSHGRAPDGTRKSLRLEGANYQLTATFPQTVSVVKAQVEKLEAQLTADDTPEVFDHLFLVDPKYIVTEEAGSWAGKLSKKALAIWQKCTKTSQSKGKVTADLKKGAAA